MLNLSARPLQHRLNRTSQDLQLAVLRRVIELNRLTARARAELSPFKAWLMLLPIVFVFGFFQGLLRHVH